MISHPRLTCPHMCEQPKALRVLIYNVFKLRQSALSSVPDNSFCWFTCLSYAVQTVQHYHSHTQLAHVQSVHWLVCFAIFLALELMLHSCLLPPHQSQAASHLHPVQLLLRCTDRCTGDYTLVCLGTTRAVNLDPWEDLMEQLRLTQALMVLAWTSASSKTLMTMIVNPKHVSPKHVNATW